MAETFEDIVKQTREERKKRSQGSASYQTWRSNQSPENLKLVVDELDPVISKGVYDYTGSDSPILKGRGRVLAAKAVSSYDPDRGADLSTHVYRQLQELQRTAPRISQPVSYSQAHRLDQARVYAKQQELQNDLGRPPSDEELGHATGLPPKRLAKILRTSRPRVPVSAMDPTMGDGEEDENDDSGVPSTERTDEDEWMDAVYYSLNDRDKVIMQYRAGYNGAPVKSNAEIAQIMGTSPAAVSQRAKFIQEKLDSYYG